MSFRGRPWVSAFPHFPGLTIEKASFYLLAGQVTVTPWYAREKVTFRKGDFVTIPAGTYCTWDVSEAVQTHYKFF